jgi:heat shock protein HslJ
MKILISIAIFQFFFLPGCSSNKSGTGNEYSLNNKWVLQNLGGKQADSTNFPHGLPEMELKTDAMAVYGNTGCNSMSGTMTAASKTIKFSQIITTKMYCEGVNETGFLNALSNADSWTIENNRLFLYSGKIVAAVFRKK